MRNSTLWKKHPAHPNFQADSTLLQPTPSPEAYLAGKSQTIREAVPANFLQGTCNFLLGLSSYPFITAASKGHSPAQNWLYLLSSLCSSAEGHKSDTPALAKGREVEEGLKNEAGNGRKRG